MIIPSHGNSFPLGSTLEEGGVNFSIFSKNASSVELLLFSDSKDFEPSFVYKLDPHKNKTYHYWHVFIPGLKPGQLYGYRMEGPYSPSEGHRFDASKTLIDPYAKSVVFDPECPKCVVVDMEDYDWEGDEHPNRPFSQTVIYEMHVGGFTKNPNSGIDEKIRGTYAGLIEKIPYLKELGITAVELLPVFQFEDRLDTGQVNYWGYNPVSFFSLHQGYSSKSDPLEALDEFRDMVKALHKAGIEVILDVVFNHTGEGGEGGPTYTFRGIDNRIYYTLDREDQSNYLNYAGCGNIMNANHPIVRRMIIDSLNYWVKYLHVDGFRFDLASILSRDEKGRPLENAPILWDIESDPVLAGTKLIAEAWDAGGLYQVGSFIGDSWKEWNGRFRDDVRGFLRGDRGKVKDFIKRLIGSPDLYAHQNREPEQSINFVTCHDGFTLNDLVSYSQKHNEANGERNQDGTNDNLSQNGGVEGPTDDPSVEAWRLRQIKNFLSLTLFSVGAPMISMGDEVRRTQFGNNNPYCQDNELSWFDWDLVEKNEGLFRYVKMLILRRILRESNLPEYSMSLKELLDKGDITWHGVRLNHPDWSDDSHSVAFSVTSMKGTTAMHVMINAFWEPLEFQLPSPKGKNWKIWIDTFQSSPLDIFEWFEGPDFKESHFVVQPNSILVLVS